MKISTTLLLGLSSVLCAMASSSSAQPGTPSSGPKGTRRRRHARDLVKLPRSAALSYLYHAAEWAAAPNFPPLSFFSPAALWAWLRNYLAYVFHRKHVFPPYTASPQHAMYDLLDEHGSDTVKIALVGDWGTGTEEAESVAARMLDFEPHFTLHIGDVYYVGDPPEVNENCLGIRNPNNNYDPVVWPIGSRGSFAMNGNHEMYADGGGYFDVLLPELGLRVNGKMAGQQTSFFCLQNSHWRIIAVDTGYNSNGLPILGQIPILNKIPGIGGTCKLRPELMDWLTTVVRPQDDKRGLVLMSHHQYYSGFEDGFSKPAQQMWQAGIQRTVLWFWGHEHRFAGYDLYGEDRLQAFGRCVGHGGMPLSLNPPKKAPTPKFYDARKGTGFGVNGHVNLEFSGPNLTATYVDLNKVRMVEEKWAVDAGGNVQMVSQQKLLSDPDFHM